MKLKKILKKGFTLVELLVVIAILAILSTIGVVGYTAFIEKSRVSNDKNLVAQLNTYLSTLQADSTSTIYGKDINEDNIADITYDILNEGGLYDNVDTTNKTYTLIPQAEQHGYHFYFDLDKQEYVLLPDNNFATPINAAYATGNETSNVRNKYLENCFDEDGRYFLVEKNTKLANLISNLKELNSSESLENLITGISDILCEKILVYLGNTVFVTGNGHWGSDNPTNVFISSNLTITSGAYTSSLKKLPALNRNAEIKITIEEGAKIPTNYFYFGSEEYIDNVTLVFPEIEDLTTLAEKVDPNFTNAKIRLANGKEYKFDGNKIVGITDTTEEIKVDSKNKVTDFSILLETDESGTLDLRDNGIALSIDHKTEFILKVGNFTAPNEDLLDDSQKTATWSSSSPNCLSVDAGIVSIEDLSAADKVTIKATINDIERSIDISIGKIKQVDKCTFTPTKDGEITKSTDVGADNTIDILNDADYWTINFDGFHYTIQDLTIGTTITMEEDLTGTFEYSDGVLTAKKTTADDGVKLVFVVGGCKYEVTVTLKSSVSIIFEPADNTNVTQYIGIDAFYVGNGNVIPLNKLFKLKTGCNPQIPTSAMLIDSTNPNSTEKLTLPTVSSWETSTINFNIQGIDPGTKCLVKLYIGDDECSTSLEVKIVDAKNVYNNTNGTDTWQGGNVVLLEDITTDTPQSITNIYGNYKTISTNYNKHDKNFISLSNGRMENLIIDGPIYPYLVYRDGKYKYGAFNLQKYQTTCFCHGVVSTGTTTITNSYISGFRAPVRINSGSLTLDGSVLEGGVLANLYVYLADTITLKNTKLIQKTNGYTSTVNDKDGKAVTGVVGAGIFIDTKDSDGVTFYIVGNTHQYNWLDKTKNYGIDDIEGYADKIGDLASEYIHNNNYVNVAIFQEKEKSSSKSFTVELIDRTDSAIYVSKDKISWGKYFTASSYQHVENCTCTADITYANNYSIETFKSEHKSITTE